MSREAKIQHLYTEMEHIENKMRRLEHRKQSLREEIYRLRSTNVQQPTQTVTRGYESQPSSTAQSQEPSKPSAGSSIQIKRPTGFEFDDLSSFP